MSVIIRYKKSYTIRQLAFGIAYSLIGASAFIPGFSGGALRAFLGIGLFYIGSYVFLTRKQYLFIGDNYIRKLSLPERRVDFSDVTSIKFFAGDYIIKAEKKELIISKDIIAEASMPAFESFWQRLQETINMRP